MAKYRFDKNLSKKSRRKAFLAYVPGIFAVYIFGFFPIAYGLPGSIVIRLSIGLPLLLVISAAVTIRKVRRREEQLASFVLEVTETGITRQQKDTPFVEIGAAAVRKISKNKAGDIVVRGSHKYEVIAIFGGLNATGELEKQLQAFSPIVPGTNALQAKYHWFLFLATGTLFDCSIILENKRAAGIAAALVIGVMIAIFSRATKSASYEISSKAWSYLLIGGLTLFCFLVKIVPAAH
jgi:hypothetical protein